MAYTAFSGNIFESAAANTACNKIINAIDLEFGAVRAHGNDAEIVLTGCVARYLQAPTDYRTFKQISFITNAEDIYDYLATNFNSLINVASGIAYQDRINIETLDGFKIQIWYTTNEYSVVEHNGVYLDNIISMDARADVGCFPNEATIGGPVQPVLLDLNEQYFNTGGGVLYAQGWSFSPRKVKKTWTIGTATPQDMAIATNIKKYKTQDYPGYSDFKVEVVSNIGQGSGLQANFFEAKINNATVYTLANNPLNVDIDVSFVNLDVLDAGSYQSTIDVDVTALNSNTNSRETIDSREIDVFFTVRSAAAEYTDPVSMAFSHTIDEDMPAPLPLFVNVSGEYTLTFAKFFSITAPGMVDESTKDFFVKRTSGAQTFAVYLNRSVENLGEGFHDHAITITHASGNLVVPVAISIAATNEIRVSPTVLNFEATIGVTEAEPQSLQIISPLAYTITKPDWLNINGFQNGDINGTVEPLAAVNFAPGNYRGNIVLDSGAGSVYLPVIYKVKANSFTDLLPGKLNFTKDQYFVTVATTIVGSYLKATVYVSYENLSNQIVNKVYPLSVPIYNGRGSFHPGELLQSILPKAKTFMDYFPDGLDSETERVIAYAKPATVDIKLEQLAYSNDALVKTDFLNNILFLKGNRPKVYGDDCGISFAEYPLRVTKNSITIFNFFKRTGAHQIKVDVNGVNEKTIPHDTLQNSSFGAVFGFSAYNPGDIINLKIDDGSGGSFSKSYYMFPENKESYHIAWVNDNEQIEIFEFTGALSVGSNYQSKENVIFKNLVNVVEILRVDKSQVVKANTGWVMKNNHLYLDSLLRSKKAWLLLNDRNYAIDIVPRPKSLSNYNSEKALNAYEVEFLINPSKDAEVYPR